MTRTKNKKKRFQPKFGRIFLVVLLLLVIVMGGTASALVIGAVRDMPRFDPNQLRASSATSFVYDGSGELLTKLHGEENRIPVKLRDIPQELQDAVIAIEDIRFHSHKGVDLRAIARGAWRIVTGQSFEGGSTITQQLVKNVFLTPDQTLTRKIQEAILAIQVERTYTKDQIMEMYLNEIHFGHGTDGVQAAAKLYFGKDVWELSLTESTILAGMIRSPNRYSPYNNMEAARSRQAVVLDQMVKYGFVSGETADGAKTEPIELVGRSSSAHPAPYFVDYVISYLVDELKDHFGTEKDVYDAIYRGGLHIYTTIDPKMQQQAEKAVAARVPEGEVDGKGIRQPQVALVTMDAQTGHLKAIIGGRDYENTKFNRAVQATRQPGSAFKTFVYAAAFDNGMPPVNIYVDEPVTISLSGGRVWQPKNYGGSYSGPVTLRRAVERSLNTVAAQLIMDVGVDQVIDYAERMGISTFVKSGNPNDRQPAISLGGLTHGVTPLDMTVSYGVLANQGVKVDPIAVLKVEDRNGNTLLENSTRQTSVLSPQTSYLMTDVLRGVITAQGGTGGRANIGRPAAGKTGTTSDYNDAWFVGYTPDLVTSVWVGTDHKIEGQPSFMQRNRIGSSVAAQIWGDYMREAVKSRAVKDFSRPSGIVGPIQICSESGLLPSESCNPENIRSDIFIAGTEPKEICSMHEAIEVCPESGDLATEFCPDTQWITLPRGADGELIGAPTEYCTMHNSPQLVEVVICTETGKLATPDCTEQRRVFFPKGTEPQEYCDMDHGGSPPQEEPGDQPEPNPEQRPEREDRDNRPQPWQP